MGEAEELSKVYHDVAERSSKLLGEFAQKQAQGMSSAVRDEMGIAKAFMDLYARMAADPSVVARLGASYAKAKKLTGSGTDFNENLGTNQTGAKMWNLGYEWALSKRTQLGFGAAGITNDPNQIFSWTASIPIQNGWQSGSVLAGQKQTNLFVSMRHSF